MKPIELKTNIMCSSCVAKVSPVLNEILGEESWTVDTQDPKKILRVSTAGLNEEDVIEAVKKAGYKAERVE